MVGRFGVGGFDSFEFHCFKAFGEALLLKLQSMECFFLFDDDLIELLVKAFELSEVGFDFLQAIF